MCCFTGTVESVSATKIFARPAENGRQFLAYHMLYRAKEALAMVLPLPTPRKAGDDAVRFINLEEYDDFFSKLEAGFPRPRAKTAAPAVAAGAIPPPSPIPVIEVGSFEASFVPTAGDFSRLDKRFRLPDGVWEKLPGYKDFGFAVFKLKAGQPKVHPIAFEFPRVKAERIFFPTVHIHDGEVHADAEFDHVLYLQPGSATRPPRDWEESPQPASLFMDVKKAQGLLAADRHVYRRRMSGKLKNADTLV
jgi:hypothetical protein